MIDVLCIYILDSQLPTLFGYSPKLSVETTKTKENVPDLASKWTIGSFANKIAVVLHSIFILYAITYAIILIFSTVWFDFRSQHCEALDEFTAEESFQFELHSNDSGIGNGSDQCDYNSNQRTSCAILGCWLVIVAGYSIVLGAESNSGWFLTSLSSAMTKLFVAKLDDDYDAVLPLGTGALDVLVFIGFTGWFAILLRTPSQHQREKDCEEYKIKSELDNVD